MLKVLHLVSSGGLFGAERVILNIIKNDDGVTSWAGSLHNAHNPHLEMIEEAKAMGLNTAVFPSKGRIDMQTVLAIRKFLKAEQINVLHTHNYKADIVGCLAAMLSGVKWVATNHTWHSSDSKMKLYEGIDAFVLRFAKKVVGVSEEIREQLIKIGLKPVKLDVIDNGIDIQQFEQTLDVDYAGKQFAVPQGHKVVSIIGRLREEKGHDVFLKAVKAVVQTYQEVKFLIVGDGPLMSTLQQTVQNEGLNEWVTFAGIRKDIPAILLMSDISVNASYVEGLPMTILESMAAKTPLIVTPVGAVPTVVKDGVNGLVVEPGDDKALAKAITQLLDDEQLGCQYAKQAYMDVVAKYSDVAMAEKYKQLYESIV